MSVPFELTVSVSIRSNEGNGSLNVYETHPIKGETFRDVAQVLTRFHNLGKLIRHEIDEMEKDKAEAAAEPCVACGNPREDRNAPGGLCQGCLHPDPEADQAAAEPLPGYSLKDVQAEGLADLAAEILEAFPFQAGGCQGPEKCLNCRGGEWHQRLQNLSVNLHRMR